MSNESMMEMQGQDRIDPAIVSTAEENVRLLTQLVDKMGISEISMIDQQIEEHKESVARLESIRNFLMAKDGTIPLVKRGRPKKEKFVLPRNYMPMGRTKRLNPSEILSAKKRMKILKWMLSVDNRGVDLDEICEALQIPYAGLNKTMMHKYFNMEGDKYFISETGYIALKG